MGETEHKTYAVKKWVPELVFVAQSVIDDVHKVAPELEVLFMGAAALGLPGKNDLDLDILCSQKDVKEYTDKLAGVLGEPRERTDKLSAWTFYRGGFEIDILISDPAISHVPEQKHVFDTLKNNPELLEEYRQLKLSCNGLPYKEYEERKKEFFKNRIPK